MRAFACVLAISLGLAAPAGAAPRKVASLKLCTDELLLMLADTGQIASVTYLSQQPLESPLWRRARHYRANDGSLLSIAALAPDLVIDMGGGGRDSARIARRLGVRMLMLPYPQSLADVEEAVRRVGDALGRPEAGVRLAARIEGLRKEAPARAGDAAWLGGGGRSFAPDGLGAQWMALLGLKQRALPGDRLTIEQLLVRPPHVLLRSDYRGGQYSSEQSWLAHPLVRRNKAWRTVAADGRRWTCMGPLMIGEIGRLRAELRR